MTNTEIERLIRRAGYDVRWDDVRDSSATGVYALRDGKRHTRSQPNLLALAEYLGCVDRPIAFIEDREGLETDRKSVV